MTSVLIHQLPDVSDYILGLPELPPSQYGFLMVIFQAVTPEQSNKNMEEIGRLLDTGKWC